MKKTSHEVAIILIPLFIFYLLLGVYLSQVRGFLPGDALARMVNAWLTIRGTEVKLASIGFVWPPIPTLLIIPLTAIPFLVRSWLAVVIVSAFSMAVSGVLIYQIAKKCSVPGLWKFLLVLLYATNPLIVVFGANGMSEAILLAVFLMGLYWLIVFWQTDSNMAIVLSAGFFSLLPLIRYEAILLTVVAALIILVQSWPKQFTSNTKEVMNKLEGRLLAFGALAIYPIFLWMLASWQIMGSPLYFINNPQSAINVAEGQLFGVDTRFLPAIGLAFRIWIEVLPLSFLATLIALFYGFARRNVFLIGLSVMSLVTPLIQGLLISQSSSVPLLRYYIINIPITVVILFVIWNEFISTLAEKRKIQSRLQTVIWTIVFALFLFSNYSTAYALTTSEYQSNENPTWLGIISTDPVPYMHIKQAGEGLKVGKVLPEIIPEGKRVLIDTYAGGYAIILASGSPELFLDFTDPNYKFAVQKPWEFADYVLIPSPDTEGKFSEINQFHPNLHNQGAGWAELIDELPETLYDWRLYKIIHPKNGGSAVEK